MGNPVFTNEAARDAVITAPSEGQSVYLTASTVASASGDTYVGTPTGVRTVYNGTNWVCVTPVGATTNTAGTTASTTWTTTLTSGGTNPSVTLETGTSALVSTFALTSAAVNAAREIGLAFGVSGATTLTPSGNVGPTQSGIALGSYIIAITAGHNYQIQRTFLITGLTAGTNTFSLYYITDNNTDTFRNRSLTVQGIA